MSNAEFTYGNVLSKTGEVYLGALEGKDRFFIDSLRSEIVLTTDTAKELLEKPAEPFTGRCSIDLQRSKIVLTTLVATHLLRPESLLPEQRQPAPRIVCLPHAVAAVDKLFAPLCTCGAVPKSAPPSRRWMGGSIPPPLFWNSITALMLNTRNLAPTINAAIEHVRVNTKSTDSDEVLRATDVIAWHMMLDYLATHQASVSRTEESFIVMQISPCWRTYLKD